MKYLLSNLIPVRFVSEYGVISDPLDPSRDGTREKSTWWQWRHRIFFHRRTTI